MEWSVLAAGCPCGISHVSLHPAAQRTHTARVPSSVGTAGAGWPSARVQWTGDDSVVAGHRGYLSLHSRAAGKPWKADL